MTSASAVRIPTVVDVSYLADTVVIFRYFEAEGAVRQAVSLLKKRTGHHERTIRELSLAPGGIAVGEPLHRFEGVLSGVPRSRPDRTPTALSV